MEMTKERKVLTGIITAVSILVGAGGWVAVEAGVMWHDTKYIKVDSGPYLTILAFNEIQNNELRFDIEDDLAAINERIANGTATPQDIRRKAVLEDRLKRL
jgi:hypothetical protein